MSAALEQLVNEVMDLTGADKPSLYEDDAPVLSDEALSVVRAAASMRAIRRMQDMKRFGS